MTSEWLSRKLPKLIEKYEPNDIYNADELGLFYQITPNSTFLMNGTKCKRGKQSKDRITVFVCCNMDGSDKIKILVIGKSEKPRCFRSARFIPVSYYFNRKAWMTANIFNEFLTKLNNRMIHEKRNILFICDNCSAHAKLNFSNIQIAFVPHFSTKYHIQIRTIGCWYYKVFERILSDQSFEKIIGVGRKKNKYK